jgi:uncharacterized protein YjbI with pentapeptide repeats
MSADLVAANLYGADFVSANLSWVDLQDANIDGADLNGAILKGANLDGASIGDAGKLTGESPYFTVIFGVNAERIESFRTEKGIFIRSGSFFGTAADFRGNNPAGGVYQAALDLVEAHYRLV